MVAVGADMWLLAAQVPEECPAEIEQLIDLCLATEPADRPTAKQAFDIIGACSLNLPPPVPHAPSPTTHQQEAVSAGALESCSPPPGMQAVGIVHASVPAMGGQSQKSLGSQPGSGAGMQSSFQPAAVADGTLASMPAPGHYMPVVGHSTPLNGLGQAPSEIQTATRSDQDVRLQDGSQPPVLQLEGGGAEHSMYSVLEAGKVTSHTAEDTHLTEGSLPLGVFGHLYPSPFAMADDDSGDSLWCWQHRQAASGVGSDQDSAEP